MTTIKASHWRVTLSDQSLSEQIEKSANFVKYIKKEAENIYLINTSSIRLSQMKAWLGPDVNITKSQPFKIKNDTNVMTSTSKKETLIEKAEHCTTKTQIELNYEFIISTEVAKQYKRILECDTNETFQEYVTKKRFYFESKYVSIFQTKREYENLEKKNREKIEKSLFKRIVKEYSN